MSLFREPDAGNLPVRFDEREQETEPSQTGLRWRGESQANYPPGDYSYCACSRLYSDFVNNQFSPQEWPQQEPLTFDTKGEIIIFVERNSILPGSRPFPKNYPNITKSGRKPVATELSFGHICGHIRAALI